MATFSAQVVNLVGAFSDETALDSFITEGANEVINAMPRPIMERVAEETTFTNTVSSEGHKILHVLKHDGTIDQPCRLVLASKRGRIQDSSDMEFATSSDPAYYIQNSLVTLFPTGDGKLVSMPTYSQASPLNADGISSITNFPNEYEYLVTLYAAIKALQQLMNNKHGNTDITGALTALEASVVNAEDEIEDGGKMVANIVLGVAEVTESAVDTDTSSSEMLTAANAITSALGQINTHSFDDEDTFNTTTSQLTRVKNSLDQVSDIINGNQPSGTTDAFGAQAAEDVELVTSSLNIAQTEIQRANAHLSEWTSILQGALSQAQGFASEVQARGVWTSAKAQVWNGYFASAGAYAQAAQTYLASAQGYANEAQSRLAVDTTEYNWYQSQQAKLQVDYDKGIQIMRGA
tara:strand:- start:8 stop:1228 length:1221 start_codon:yes stop_codon:yes gene_type:complete